MNDTLILSWIEANKILIAAKAIEIELRNRVVAEVFANHTEDGSETIDLGKGYKLKGVFTTTYKLKNDDSELDKAIAKIKSYGPEGVALVEQLIRYKPEISQKEYKNLHPVIKEIIDTALVTKPGSPQIDFITPKE